MNLLMNSVIEAWGSALLNFLWQGLLVGLIAAVLLGLSRQARPQIRYAIACIALVLCFTLPIVGVWQSLSMDAVTDTGIVALPSTAGFDTAVLPAMSADTVTGVINNQLPLVVIAWSLGCAFFSLRMAMGLSWISNARRHSLANASGSLQSKLNLLAIQFGVRRPIQLLICNDIDSPVTAGWWKPVVMVPAALVVRLPPDYIEALLAHELAHIKRHDYLINLLQSFIEAVLFFHPAVWWLSKQIRIERENIADDLAAEVLGEPRQLAVALAALDEFQFAGPLLAPAAHGGNLMSRIQRLIKPTQHVLGWKISAVLVCLAFACMTAYAYDKSSAPRLAGTPTSAVEPVAAIEAGDTAEAADAAEAEPAEIGEPTVAADAADAVDVEEAGEASKVDDSDEVDNITINNMGRHETYALVVAGKDGMMLSGSISDIKTIDRIRKNLDGDFLWFRRDGKTYVVQDPATLAEVKKAWQGSDKLSAQMEALSVKMEVHSKVMEGISSKMESVSRGGEGRNEVMEKTARDMEILGKQQETIGRQMTTIGERIVAAKSDQQREAIDRDMRAQQEKMAVLDRQMEKLAALMEQHSAKLENDLKPLEALSREMELASKPMESLGQQMSVLGKQQEVLSKQADQKVLGVINNSLKNGQARPLGNLTH